MSATAAPKTLLAFGALLLLAGAGERAGAADAPDDPGSPVRLEWAAPAGCPSRAEVSERVVRILGAAARSGEPLRARGAVTAAASGGWKGELWLSAAGQTSTRQVEGDSCSGVSDAMALIIALAVDPDAELPKPAPPASGPSPSAAPPKPAPPPARPEPQRLTFPTSPRPHPFFLGVAGLVDVGTLPKASAGGEATLGWMSRPLLVEVGASLVAPTTATLASSPLEGARFRFVSVGARACYDLLDGRFGLGPCAGGGAVFVLASGFGSRNPSDATGTVPVVAAGGRASARLSELLSLRIGVEATLPVVRPTFLIANAGDVYQVRAGALRAQLGGELHF